MTAAYLGLLVAALLDSVSGSLDTVENVPSYFGEVTVTSINAAPSAELPAAPKLPILLTQGSLQAAGEGVKEAPVQLVKIQKVDAGLTDVCERTRKVLLAQADASSMPTGPVFKECMAGLAPLRVHQQEDDAVGTLSDCMALVNALIANKNGDCHDIIGVVQAAQKPAGPAPVKESIAKPQPAAAPVVPVALPKTKAVETNVQKTNVKQTKAKMDAEALDLVSEAMSAVCTETVKDAEVGIKSETDAMKLSNAVAPICQQKAIKHLGAVAAATPLTKEWCQQLDGRLTLALETGFFFALSPQEAERQASESNPYASTTRRKFCGRFVASIAKQAKDGALYLNGPPAADAVSSPSQQAETASQPARAAPVPVVQAEAAAPEAVAPERLPTLPPAPNPEVPAVPVTAAPQVATQAAPQVAQAAPVTPVAAPSAGTMPMTAFGHAEGAAKPIPLLSAQKGSGVDMLQLVQSLSARSEWNQVCTTLISKLSSEEGSVTNEYALGDRETSDSTKVLTFNAADQGQIRKCAAQLKILAVQSGVPAGEKKGVSFLTLDTADDAEGLMDSPWAEDACGDVAHGYLTAHLAHPGMTVADFCPLYAKDLQAMHAAKSPEEQTKQDMQRLRKGSSLKRKLAKAQALRGAASDSPAPQAPAAPVKKLPPAALITENASNEEKEGMDFWGGLLQN